MASLYQSPSFSLGELERSVLDVLWSHSPLKPGDVHARLGPEHDISVNTVASALKRLHDKGVLEREKVSHSYVYSPTVTRAELQKRLIHSIVDEFGGAGTLSAFLDITEQQGPEALKKLEAMLAARRKEGRK